MTLLFRASSFQPFRLTPIAAFLLAAHSMLAAPQQKPAAAQAQPEPDRSAAYYHYGLAHLYEEMAVSAGRPDYATQAVEEYKLALNADPNSVQLADGLADLYFKIGRMKDAVTSAQEQAKKNPNDLDAHLLLGKMYVRLLGDMQGAQAAETLQLAIAEYEIVARLKPDDVETKLLLGQLYAANHQSAKAEAEFKEAQKLDGGSEEVILRMAALYGDQGEVQHAADILAPSPRPTVLARIEFCPRRKLRPPQEAEGSRRCLQALTRPRSRQPGSAARSRQRPAERRPVRRGPPSSSLTSSSQPIRPGHPVRRSTSPAIQRHAGAL